MKLIKPIFLAFLTLTSSSLIAQTTIKGSIVSGNEPIPYATIGIKEKDIGTVADEKGNFILYLKTEEVSNEDVLLISSVGFINKEIKYKDFFKATGPIVVTLNKNSIALDEIKVKPKKVREKRFGKTGVPKFTFFTMFIRSETVNDALGREVGGVIKIDKDIKVKEFKMYVFNQFKNVKFRLKFYDLTNLEKPVLITIQDDIIFDVDTAKGWVKVNLLPYNIYIEGKEKIGVAIQWLKSEQTSKDKKFFSIPASITPFSKSLHRLKSEALWTFPKFHLSMYITADSYSD